MNYQKKKLRNNPIYNSFQKKKIPRNLNKEVNNLYTENYKNWWKK